MKTSTRMWGGFLALTLGIPAIGWSQSNEFGELGPIINRSVFMSLPPDPDSALEALTTMDQGANNVIGMHLGRINPTPYESTPGVAPLIPLTQARLDLLTSPTHHEKKIEDTFSANFSILLLPVDATTAIVILPTQAVEAAPAAAPPREILIDLGAVEYTLNGNTRTVAEYMEDGATNGIAFMHNGKFIYDAYQNGFTQNTRHQLWSCTKSVTTALVGFAVDEGLIDSIHDPIAKYIPEATGSVWDGADPVTIEDLLQMESGTYWVDVPIHQPEELVLMGLDFHTNGLYGMTRDDYLLELTRVDDPGASYLYNSGDAQMLAWLLENVYGKFYAEILSEKLWKPLGMQDEALIMVDRTGDAFASMGLFATTRDMLRFGELFRNGGYLTDDPNDPNDDPNDPSDDIQILSEEWVTASTLHSAEGDASGGGPRAYMWPEFAGDDGYTASGYGHQRVSVIPELNLVGVRFGNDPIDTVAPAEWEAVFKAVGEHLELLPEPGTMPGLLAGGVLLAGLARRGKRRTSAGTRASN